MKRGGAVTDEIRSRVMAALLKSLYQQDFISEDVYHHSLGNLPKASGLDRKSVYDAAKIQKEVGAGGRL